MDVVDGLIVGFGGANSDQKQSHGGTITMQLRIQVVRSLAALRLNSAGSENEIDARPAENFASSDCWERRWGV